ncbi:MAG TPA: cobalamin-binding protein [Thermodesulfobacteriota bacterium]|nr:cobalamin-binding protein [Thermodesulfobacteriota bacterium]
MRICSLLPSATEIVYALGLGENLVGVTHECDYPPEARSKPRVIGSLINPEDLTSYEIDKAVSENYKAGKSTYIVDIETLRRTNPDIILTQGLCDVCAVSGNEVIEAGKVLGHKPKIISQEPNTLGEILNTILLVGEATERKEQSEYLVNNLRSRIAAIKSLLGEEKDRPRVFCMEWLDPSYVAGHWVPEMVRIAGGDYGFGKVGKPSFKISWDEILDFAPQVIVLMPCGFNIERTLREVDTLTSNEFWNRLPAVRKGHVYIVDANSYFSRPGPRIVDGLEILAKILHPELCAFEIPPDSSLNLRNYMHLEAFLG